MKAVIDRSGCIGCGLCPTLCPEVFAMAEDGLAQVIVPEIPAEAEAAALRAMSPDDRAAFLRLTRQYRLLFEQQLRTLSSQGGTPPDPAAQQ